MAFDPRTATFEELEAAGLDDCGLPLEGHPPLPKVGPWRSPGWPSRDRVDVEKRRLGAAKRRNVFQPSVFGRGYGRDGGLRER